MNYAVLRKLLQNCARNPPIKLDKQRVCRQQWWSRVCLDFKLLRHFLPNFLTAVLGLLQPPLGLRPPLTVISASQLQPAAPQLLFTPLRGKVCNCSSQDLSQHFCGSPFKMGIWQIICQLGSLASLTQGLDSQIWMNLDHIWSYFIINLDQYLW